MPEDCMTKPIDGTKNKCGFDNRRRRDTGANL
jgi:hypothetical protein